MDIPTISPESRLVELSQDFIFFQRNGHIRTTEGKIIELNRVFMMDLDRWNVLLYAIISDCANRDFYEGIYKGEIPLYVSPKLMGPTVTTLDEKNIGVFVPSTERKFSDVTRRLSIDPKEQYDFFVLNDDRYFFHEVDKQSGRMKTADGDIIEFTRPIMHQFRRGELILCAIIPINMIQDYNFYQKIFEGEIMLSVFKKSIIQKEISKEAERDILFRAPENTEGNYKYDKLVTFLADKKVISKAERDMLLSALEDTNKIIGYNSRLSVADNMRKINVITLVNGQNTGFYEKAIVKDPEMV